MKKVTAYEIKVGLEFINKKTGDKAKIIAIESPTGTALTMQVVVTSTYVEYVFRSPSRFEECFKDWRIIENETQA